MHQIDRRRSDILIGVDELLAEFFAKRINSMIAIRKLTNLSES